MTSTTFGFEDLFAGALLGWTLKATVALAIAGLAAGLLARRSASLRHLVWTAAVCAVLGLPLAALLAPDWRIAPMATALPRTEAATDAKGSHEIVLTDEHGNVTTITPETDARTIAALIADAEPLEASVRPAADTTNPQPPPIPLAVRWPQPLLAVWALGAFAVAAFFLVGHAVVHGIAVGAIPAAGAWGETAWEAARRIGVTRPFELLRCESGVLPMSLGIFRPRILLPAAASSWPEERLLLVIMHELAHVRRRDCLTQALAQLACAVLWFHPAVWYASHRMQVERERACDDEVLRGHTVPSQYADHLIEVVRSLRAPRVTALGAVSFARRSQLEGRVLAVLRPGLDRARVSPASAGRVIALALLTLIPLAAIAPSASGGRQPHPNREARAERRGDRDGVPTTIVQVPDLGALEERVAWVRKQTSSGSEYWIGYAIDERAQSGDVIGDTGDFDLRSLNDPSTRLRDVLGVNAEHGLAVFAHGVEQDEVFRVDRLRFQSFAMPGNLGSDPLFWMGDAEQSESIEILSKLLLSKHEDVAKQTAIAIGHHTETERVVLMLAKILERKDSSEELRIGAIEGLGLHSSEQVVGLLDHVIHNDPSMDVRRHAVEALGKTGTDHAKAILDDLVDLPGFEDLSAAESMEDADEQEMMELAPMPEAHPTPGAPVAPEVPPGFGYPTPAPTPSSQPPTPVAPYLVVPDVEPPQPGKAPNAPKAPKAHKTHKTPNYDLTAVEVQRQAVEALGRQPESISLPQLMKIAERHPSVDVQRQAVSSIGLMGTPAALALLEKFAWRHPNGDVRREAVGMMGRFDEGAYSKVLEVARKHPDVETRRSAVEAIGRVPGTESREALEHIVSEDSSEDVQRQAVEALGRREDATVQRLVGIARNHPNSNVRREAVDSIGRMDSDEAVRVLEKLIQGK